MAKTEVILTNNVIGLGAESDHVKVAAGYARNYLFPQGLAIPLTAANKRRLEALRQRRAEREGHEFNTMSELAKGLSKMLLVVTAKAGEEGKMFGSILRASSPTNSSTSSTWPSTKRKSIWTIRCAHSESTKWNCACTRK